MSQLKVRCRGIIMHEDKLLLVKHSGGRDFYALPGGHLDFGENPKKCMRRELVEELGIEPTIGRLLYVYSFTKEDAQSVEFFFEIENGHDYLTHAEKEKTHAHEIAEVIWVGADTEVPILPQELKVEFKNGTLLHEGTRFING